MKPYKVYTWFGNQGNQVDDGNALISQIYFPGWVVQVDGRRVSDKILKANVSRQGTIIVPISRGVHIVTAWYDGPPGWFWRVVLFWLALLVIPALVVSVHRQAQPKKMLERL